MKIYSIKNEDYWAERQELNDLKIEEVVDKNNNIMKIKFKPNYKQSSTRYIILIAQKNTENTLDNFKNPCYITGLLNQIPEGVKVDIIYDVGDSDSINAEVDISNILNGDDQYIVTIISQELRFNKKIKFYEPKEFTHKDNPSDNNPSDKATLALAIALPIIGVLIIIIVVLIIIFKRKSVRSDDIEGISKLNEMTNE